MIKRIIRVFVFIITTPLVMLYALLGIPVLGLFILVNYIITGEDKSDIILDVGDVVLRLPHKLTKNL